MESSITYLTAIYLEHHNVTHSCIETHNISHSSMEPHTYAWIKERRTTHWICDVHVQRTAHKILYSRAAETTISISVESTERGVGERLLSSYTWHLAYIQHCGLSVSLQVLQEAVRRWHLVTGTNSCRQCTSKYSRTVCRSPSKMLCQHWKLCFHSGIEKL